MLQHRKVVAFAQEAVGVVVFDECQYGSGVGVEEVVYEVIVYAVQSLEPSFGLFILGGVYLVEGVSAFVASPVHPPGKSLRT